MKIFTVAYLEQNQDISRHLEQVLSTAENFELIGNFCCAEEALREARFNAANLYLVDVDLPGMNGLHFIETAKQAHPGSDYIVYSTSDSCKELLDAFAVGAVGYLSQKASDEDLLRGLALVANGGGLISPHMARRLSNYFQAIGPQRQVLTKKEQQVLAQLRAGKTYSQIAEDHLVSMSTVQTHIKNIYRKLNVNNRQDAVTTGVLFDLLNG
ncbi:MAG: response regulator transcription factor [Desulfuromonadaceae bacterium]|nr:response regulator transcription factor [Desulfuromonadaceae bacterium]